MHEIGRFIDDALGLSALSANDLTVAQVGLRAVVVYFALVLFVRLDKNASSARRPRLMRCSSSLLVRWQVAPYQELLPSSHRSQLH
jgi:hypothetical protein